MNVSISASYNGNGSAGNPLTIFFGSDGFGPSSANFSTVLSGSVISGIGLPILFTNYVITGSAVPTVATPIPAGASGLASPPPLSSVGGFYSGSANGGPISLSSYSLEEQIILSGSSAGSGYSIQASLTVVPEPSVAALGIMVAGAFGMMRRRRYALEANFLKR